MAKNYEEYEYYNKKYDKDLGEVEKLRDEAREERIEEINHLDGEIEDKDTQKILNAFDEDWPESDVDKTKVADILK
jgi:hypothetical protein